MAIINSVVVGRGKKSVGEVSLRYERGRTIASRRITENKSNTELQSEQRAVFGTVTKALHSLQDSLFSVLAVKSRYGSERNNYYRKNKRWFQEAASEWNQNEIGRITLMTFGDLIARSFQVMEDFLVNGELNQATLDGVCTAGNMDCTEMRAYNGNNKTNEFMIELDDVKEGDPSYIQNGYLVIWTATNNDELGTEAVGVGFVAGYSVQWDDDNTASVLKMGYQQVQGPLGAPAYRVIYNASVKLKTTTSLETTGGMPSDATGFVAIPCIRYKTTKDETKMCTLPWNAIQAGTTSKYAGS